MTERLIQSISADPSKYCVLGQSVDVGSYISGLAGFLKSVPAECSVINTPNTEGATIAYCFGLALMGKHPILVVKQLDFVLLMIEQLVNTSNAFRAAKRKVGLTILCYVVDSGFEGPQSRFAQGLELANLTGVNVYSVQSREGCDAAIDGAFGLTPNISILLMSQRFANENTGKVSQLHEQADRNDSFSLYRLPALDGSQILVIFSFFSYCRAAEFEQIPNYWGGDVGRSISACDHLVLHKVNIFDSLKRLSEVFREYRKIVIIDDSKSQLNNGDLILQYMSVSGWSGEVITLFDRARAVNVSVSPDQFNPVSEVVKLGSC